MLEKRRWQPTTYQLTPAEERAVIKNWRAGDRFTTIAAELALVSINLPDDPFIVMRLIMLAVQRYQSAGRSRP